MALGLIAMACAYSAGIKIKGIIEEKREADRKRAILSFCIKGVPTRALTVSDVMKDWEGEKHLFPVEYRRYFSSNNTALQNYALAVSKDSENISNGKINRIMTINYPLIEKFFKRYGKKIKIFNNTGVLYY